MYTITAINDIHTRAHISLSKLIKHCESLTPEQFTRDVEGFGIPSVQKQLQHIIGAERYWVGVLNGQMLVDEDPKDAESIATLDQFRSRVFDVTSEYLESTDDQSLNTPKEFKTWGNKEVTLVPALALIRTQTHIFQHLGQVTAMCRMADKPILGGMDFTILEL